MHLTRKLLIVAAALASVALIRTVTADHAWQAMLDTGSEMEQVLANHETRRPVLHGDAIEGFAFEEYELAIDLLSETALEDWIAVVQADRNGDMRAKELRDSLIDKHAATLAALSRGARSTDPRFTTVPMTDDDFPTLLETRHVVNIAVFAANRHLEEERPDLAVNLLLDCMQLGRDMMETPYRINEMIGVSLLAIASKEALVDGNLIECIPAPQLARLAAGMEQLDATIDPLGYSWEGELAALTQRVSQGHFEENYAGYKWNLSALSIPHLFSTRALLADYVARSARRREIMRGLDSAPWSERHDTIMQLAKEADAECHRFLGFDYPAYGTWVSSELSRKEGLVVFRLARIGVEFAASGQTPTLADPFGTELLLTEEGETLRVASVIAPERRNPNRLTIELR